MLLAPVGLVGKTIKHILKYEARGAMVVPYWVSTSYWPLPSNGKGQFLWFIKEAKMFSDTQNIFSNSSVKSISNETFSGTVLVLRFDAS